MVQENVAKWVRKEWKEEDALIALRQMDDMSAELNKLMQAVNVMKGQHETRTQKQKETPKEKKARKGAKEPKEKKDRGARKRRGRSEGGDLRGRSQARKRA